MNISLSLALVTLLEIMFGVLDHGRPVILDLRDFLSSSLGSQVLFDYPFKYFFMGVCGFFSFDEF